MSRCVGRAIDCVVPARSTVAVGVSNSVSPPLDARYEIPVSEKTLPGGNTVGAVRIGDAVHKQASPCTPTVHALLRYLENAGVEGVPPALGFGRQASSVPWWTPGIKPRSHSCLSRGTSSGRRRTSRRCRTTSGRVDSHPERTRHSECRYLTWLTIMGFRVGSAC